MKISTDEQALEQFRYLLSEIATVYSRKGIDLRKEAHDWADRYLQRLRDRGAGVEIDILLAKRCKKLPLAAVTWLSVFLAAIPRIHYDTLGDISRQKYLTGEFESTANLFDAIHKAWSSNGGYTWPLEAIVPSPYKMAAHLRWYRFIDFVPPLFERLKVNSSQDIERYFPAAYVKHSTNKWHDEEVSALVSAATQRSIDGHVQLMWRNRSYERIQLHGEFVARLADLLDEFHHKS